MESAFQWHANTKVEFLKKLPSTSRLVESLGFKPEKMLLIFDKRLARQEAVKKWMSEFPHTYGVTSGERLKDLQAFPAHVKAVFQQLTPFSNRSLAIVAVGGGSVGDFAGFLSSVLKRGVPLVHVPSTLLAAMDSAHGGKTALNVGEIKNQIGTFHPPQLVVIVKSLFEGLPELQLQSAGGELAKMALLEGGELYERYRKQFKLDFETLWSFLPEVIAAKYKIVAKDPFEKLGDRQLLNLGHTLGHALESYFALPHGLAVAQGLEFAVQWSQHQGFLRAPRAAEIIQELRTKLKLPPARAFAKEKGAMSRSKLMKLVVEDKKLIDARHVNFVFLENAGAAFCKSVTVEALLTESQRQGWTRL